MTGIDLHYGKDVELLYTNHRGETAVRKFRIADDIFWGSNEWHPEPQWLVDGWDREKRCLRTFALKDLRPVPLPSEAKQ